MTSIFLCAARYTDTEPVCSTDRQAEGIEGIRDSVAKLGSGGLAAFVLLSRLPSHCLFLRDAQSRWMPLRLLLSSFHPSLPARAVPVGVSDSS